MMSTNGSNFPTSTDLEATWRFLEEGIDLVMNKLDQGLSYKKYMELYTYPFS